MVLLKKSAGVIAACLFAAAVATPAYAENNPLGATAACGPGVQNKDNRTPEALAQALYEIVSGPAGSKKDWARMHALFAPGGLVTPTWHGAGFLAAPQTPEQFSALNDRLLGNRDFFEREITQQVQVYGHMAHVLSSFETRNAADGPARARGLNGFQLLNDGQRWCILSITWEIETPDHPLPPQFERAASVAGK